MRIILNGRMVGKKKSNRWIACYNQNKAYFTKEGLERRIVLHEVYHHLVYSKGLEIASILEEREKQTIMPEPSYEVIKNYVGNSCDTYTAFHIAR
jgi:hypothetical protein